MSRSLNMEQVVSLTDMQLIALLDKINDALWARHHLEEGDQELEGLETLTSAIDELNEELVE